MSRPVKWDNVKVINLRETFTDTVSVGHTYEADRSQELMGDTREDWRRYEPTADDLGAPRGLAQGLALGLCCWGVVGLLIWVL